MKNTSKKITLESLDQRTINLEAKMTGGFKNVQAEFVSVRQEMSDGFRGVKVLIEQMDKKWDLVAEQYHSILKRLHTLEDRSIHQATTLSEMKVDIRLLKNEVANISEQLSEKIGRKEFSDLQRRVSALEKTQK